MSDILIDDLLPKHERLTPVVITILESILRANNIAYLAITGRTKDRTSAIEKVRRKNYQNPAQQLTDLSGIRVVLFSESDVRAVSELVSKTFAVDEANSLNQDDRLGTNQTGYRSVHFVCDLGRDRNAIPEYSGLAQLKFEIQIRTVLQHAWAELSHDRNYKFSGQLPHDLERRLFLYAGLLEIADKGFDELSKSIDSYASEAAKKAQKGDLDAELDSITLQSFVVNWAKTHGLSNLQSSKVQDIVNVLEDLSHYGVSTLQQLDQIIPKDFATEVRKCTLLMTESGLVRRWMIAHDWKRFRDTVKRPVFLQDDTANVLFPFIDQGELAEFTDYFCSTDPIDRMRKITQRRSPQNNKRPKSS